MPLSRNRLRHLASRAREAPPSYVAWKAKDFALRLAWSTLYAANATETGHRLTRDFAFTPAGGVDDGRDYAAVAANLRDRRPDHHQLIVDRANRLVLSRLFPVLGFGEVALGDPVMWDRDLVSGAEWPRAAAFRLDYVRADERSDVKVAWEVGRLQFLPWLAQAWLATDDPAYLRTARELLADWTKHISVGMGIQWACPMDVAIRSLNLLWFARLARTGLDDGELATIGRELAAHLGFLKRHRERADVNGNHFFIGLAAIVILELGGSPSAPHLAELLDEVLRQFDADGVHLEHATNYHRLVSEVAVLVVVEMRRVGVEVPVRVRDRLLAALEFLEDLGRDSDGVIPLIGDSDSGQAVVLGTDHVNDVRALVESGRRALGDDVPLSQPLTAWLLGLPVRSDEPTEPSRSGLLLRQASGFAVVKCGETRLVLRSGPAGRGGLGGHDHSDLTSFTLDIGEEEILVDPGTSSYTADPARRAYEISAAAHNVCLVDELDPARTIAGSVMPVLAPGVVGCVDGTETPDHSIVLEAAHDGYRDEPGLGAVMREVEVSPDGRRIRVRDRIEGADDHRVSLALHLSPSVTVTVDQDGVVITTVAGRRCRLDLTGWDIAGERLGTVSPRYGERVSAPVLDLRTDAVLPSEHTLEITVERG